MKEAPPILPEEVEAARRIIEDSWFKAVDTETFAPVRERFDIFTKYDQIASAALQFGGVKLEGLSHTIDVNIWINPFYPFKVTRRGNTTYRKTQYSQINAFPLAIEFGVILDKAVPLGVEVKSNVIAWSRLLQAKTLFIGHKKKKLLRQGVLKDFFNKEADFEDSWFPKKLKELVGERDLIDDFGYNYYSIPDVLIRIAPFMGKTLLTFIFTALPIGKIKPNREETVDAIGAPRKIMIWTLDKDMIQIAIKVFNRAIEVIDLFDVGGKQSTILTGKKGLIQLYVMNLAREKFMPDHPEIALRNLWDQTDVVKELRKALNNDVEPGEWGTLY